MIRLTRLVAPALFLAVSAVGANAQGQNDPAKAAVMARHAHMDLFAFNLATLGGMAQGKIPYDATAATAAAGNIAALAHMDWTAYWVPGSEAGTIEGSRALPAIWTSMDDFNAKHMALADAADGVAAAAGTGLDALKASLGPLGGACGDCHKAYRQSN